MCSPQGCTGSLTHIQNTHTYTNSYMTQQITDAWQFIKQFLSIFTFVIFSQSTIIYIWMKGKFSPLYD